MVFYRSIHHTGKILDLSVILEKAARQKGCSWNDNIWLNFICITLQFSHSRLLKKSEVPKDVDLYLFLVYTLINCSFDLIVVWVLYVCVLRRRIIMPLLLLTKGLYQIPHSLVKKKNTTVLLVMNTRPSREGRSWRNITWAILTNAAEIRFLWEALQVCKPFFLYYTR